MITQADDKADAFKTYLLQNKIYGTYLFGVASNGITILMNLNLLFCANSNVETNIDQQWQESKKQRLSILGFRAVDIQQSSDSAKLAICSEQQSLFIFDWNPSDFGDSDSMLENLAEAVMSRRLEGTLLSNSTQTG